jgi:starch-binding outer membrane protein, SusD/RagB family
MENLFAKTIKTSKMKKKYNHSIASRIWILILFLGIFSSGCNEDFFNMQPLDATSDATFWKTGGDAQLALVGCYNTGAGWQGEDFWTPRSMVYLDLMAGNGSEKELIPDHVTDGTLTSSYWVTANYWSNGYKKITTCNNFLDHIDQIDMDATQKDIMIAEVRTLRAYQYFNLALYFGDVPLVKHILTTDEANSVTRTPKVDVWSFVETELKESADVLPATRPDAENGRITAGAALGILGRLQMAEKKWNDAATTYKKIMDFGCYNIDPDYRELFQESHEFSKEIIMSSQYIPDTYGQVLLIYLTPEQWGGWHQFSPFNELVKTYECTDGQTIENSPLYDENQPYDNRDPRLDATIFIPERTVFRGSTYTTNPSSDNADKFGKYPVWSGYSILKFMEDDPSVNVWSAGENWIIIRYAEVLLGYLESELESGTSINQQLLDQTINLVRGRAAVNMPPVTITDPTQLREIVRRERRVEFAFEGLRYYDILRWGIAADELNHQFTGQKLTNDPANYTTYPVDADGYYIMSQQNRKFIKGVNELWPIPQSERDINPNLTQNTGY